MINRPVLIATLGCPGSGKSTLAEKYAANRGMLHLSSEAIRSSLTAGRPNYSDYAQSKLESQQTLQEMVRLAIIALTDNVSVFFDRNNNHLSHRKALHELAQPLGALATTAWVNVSDMNLAIRRTQNRNRPDSPDVYVDLSQDCAKTLIPDMNQDIQPPTIDEPHIIISGEVPYSHQEAALDNYLHELKKSNS